jgi:hypothetical protein
MIFPSWFFQTLEPGGLRIPVEVSRFLPCDATNAAGEVIGKRHWSLIEGTLYMSREAFAELKRQTDAQPDDPPITVGP